VEITRRSTFYIILRWGDKVDSRSKEVLETEGSTEVCLDDTAKDKELKLEVCGKFKISLTDAGRRCKQFKRGSTEECRTLQRHAADEW
jgi:hypothetical protein